MITFEFYTDARETGMVQAARIEVIEKRVKILQQGPYEDAREELTEIAAFLGVQLERYMGGKWEHFVNGNFESCSVEELNSTVRGANCINLLLGSYAGNGMEWTKNVFLKIYTRRKISP